MRKETKINSDNRLFNLAFLRYKGRVKYEFIKMTFLI